MEKRHVILASLAGIAFGFLIGNKISDIGKPTIKILPFTKKSDGESSVLNFEVGGKAWNSSFTKKSPSSPLGTIGDVTWNLNIDSGKNVTISAYNEKSKKSSAYFIQLPDDFVFGS
jgi:hypothetical protein